MSYEDNKILGYVRLYRSVSGHYAVDKDNDHFRLWCELLIQAAHQQGRIMMFNGSRISLNKGQLITGRDVLAGKTHIHRSKVERILNFFENEQQIEQQKTPSGRLITVIKLKEYHSYEQQIEQQVSNKRATSEQQVSTNNKGNKGNKENKDNTYTAAFNIFWSKYPKKVGKGAALSSWKRVGVKNYSAIYEALEKQKGQSQWRKENGRYIPNPSTWLNQRRWEDEWGYEVERKKVSFE